MPRWSWILGCALLLNMLACDAQVDTSDLAEELRPKSGETIERTVAHASCSGSDVHLEYTNAVGEEISRCFGLKEDTQICSLATCETSSDMSEAEKARLRKDKRRRSKR